MSNRSHFKTRHIIKFVTNTRKSKNETNEETSYQC